MKKALCVFVSLVLLLGCAGLPAFAEGYANAQDANNALTDYSERFHRGFAEDVDGDDKFTARDARTILLYSAELYDRLGYSTDLHVDRMDLDGDGMITAVDARRALRFSAHLIEDDKFTAEQKLEMFNTVVNNLKPNKHNVQFLYATKNEYTDVSWDNKSAVNSFDNQMANLAKADNSMNDENFSSTLSASKGQVEYSSPRTATPRLLSITDIPLSDQTVSSRLTANDISNIVFKSNQTVTLSFTYKVVNDIPLAYIEPITLTGLNALTVTLKNDALIPIDGDFSTTHASKIIDQPDIEKLKEESTDLADELNTVKDSLTELNDINVFRTCKFDLSASITKFRAHNVKFTVYFQPSTGKPIATVVDYDFDYVTKMLMDIDMAFNWTPMATTAVLALRAKGVTVKDHLGRADDRAILQIKNQTVNVTNTKHTYANYYFVSNNTNP